MIVESIETVAGIRVPDSALARDVHEFIPYCGDDLLFNHSRGVFFFGALQGFRRGLQPDLERVYVGAIFHDLGLTERYRTSTIRFEVDGADAARDFLTRHGVDDAGADKVWLGIALHTTPGVPEFMAPETALIQAGVEVDVLGLGRSDLGPEVQAAVTAAHPRPDFKNRILAAFTDGMKHRPQTTYGTMNADVLERFDPTFKRNNMVSPIPTTPRPDRR